MFSGTNFLKSYQIASCLFFFVFGSRKAENQYSRNWTGQKPKSVFYRGEHEARRRDGGGPRGGHTPWPHGWAHPAPGGCSRLGHPWASLLAYKKPPMPKP